jgi:hypothetical protein
MAASAERMRELRNRRRERDLWELRLFLPDPRRESVRASVAAQAARLNPDGESEALCFREAISEFDAPDPKET